MIGHRFAAAVLACVVVTATGIAAGGAATAQDAGLTCVATGQGTSWNLGVTGASMPVGGYVAGFPGGTITSFSIDGFPGQPDTSGLPAGISNGIFAQIPSGRDVVLHVVTSAPPSGPFNVAFINQAQTGYGPLFACPIDSGPGGGSAAGGGANFTMAVGDFNGDGSPDLIVTGPGPGAVFVVQDFSGRALGRARVTLVASEKVVVKKAGKVVVPLHATAAGKALLAKKGSFSARVKVTFTARNGASSSRTASVTFKKS